MFTCSHTKEPLVLRKYSKVDVRITMVRWILIFIVVQRFDFDFMLILHCLGVSHAEELQYLFPIADGLFISALPTKEDEQVRKAITELWVNFARTG